MRPLYFTRDYTPHDHRFLSALAGSAHSIYSLRLERSGRQLEDRPLPPQVEQVQWRGGQAPLRTADAPALLADLKRVIRRVQPDVIHAGPIQSAAFLAALSGFRPLVSMSWGSDLLMDAERDWKMRYATRYTLRRSTVLVGDCDAVRKKAGEFGFPAGRVVLFPWGVDLTRFSTTSLSPLEANSRRTRSTSLSSRVLEWDLTAMPRVFSFAMNSLFSIPNSLASSYTLVLDILETPECFGSARARAYP